MSFIDGDNMVLNLNISDKSIEKLNRVFDTPTDIALKIIDIYNYMAKNNSPTMALKFEDGMKIFFHIDASEYTGVRE